MIRVYSTFPRIGARLSYTFVYPVKRRPHIDKMIAALKMRQAPPTQHWPNSGLMTLTT